MAKKELTFDTAYKKSIQYFRDNLNNWNINEGVEAGWKRTLQKQNLSPKDIVDGAFSIVTRGVIGKPTKFFEVDDWIKASKKFKQIRLDSEYRQHQRESIRSEGDMFVNVLVGASKNVKDKKILKEVELTRKLVTGRMTKPEWKKAMAKIKKEEK